MSRKERKKLGRMTCTSTACDDNLHCFRQAKKRGEQHLEGGRCRDCGADLVDFPRVHKRDYSDVNYTWRSLKYELIRHHFWHLDIDVKAVNYARRKGKIGMRAAAENRIRKSVGPADPAFDGRQTGKSGNPLYYAQHATATCCRKCIEYWHGVPRHQALTEPQIAYFTGLLMGFVSDRFPNLSEHGEKVPLIKPNGNEDSDFFAQE